MQIYVARHGQTDWNVQHKAQGRSVDLPLNPTGIKQAQALRDQIKTIKFDAIYTSPLKRAVETATIVAAGQCEVIRDIRLIQRSLGDAEGQVIDSWSELIAGVNTDDITADNLPHNIEPVQKVLARVRHFLKHLKRQYDDEANILIIEHGAVAKAFDWILAGHPAKDSFSANHLNNTEIKIYSF